MARVEFSSVTKTFPPDVRAIDALELEVEDGEFMVLVGPSGCGKSTALRLLAGLDTVSSGEIRIDGETVNERSPQERNIAMVFQNYALYPHKTVRRNMEFPLRMMRLSRQEIRERIERVSRLLGLEKHLDRRPRELSGGQRQRVAMGRALVRDPVVFLMDEPLSNLDAKLRVEIRTEIAELQRRTGITTVYVTHDQVEAMTLGDRVAVLREGRLQQVAPSQELYERPANVFVAGFIGSPRMNIFRSRLRKHEQAEDFAFDFGDRTLPVPADSTSDPERIERNLEEPVFVGLRPEAFSLETEDDTLPRISVEVVTAEALGHECIVYAKTPVEVVSDTEGGSDARGDDSDSPPGDSPPTPPTSSTSSPGKESTIVARLPAHRMPERGDALELAVDTRQCFFFDARGRNLERRRGDGDGGGS